MYTFYVLQFANNIVFFFSHIIWHWLKNVQLKLFFSTYYLKPKLAYETLTMNHEVHVRKI